MNRSLSARIGNPTAAFLLSAALWTAALALFGIFPFGERSLLVSDMGQQYIDFYAGLYDAFTKGGSLLFSWNAGLGMNMVGLTAYYLSSPFTPLMLLFPRALLPEALLLIISLKIAAAGLTIRRKATSPDTWARSATPSRSPRAPRWRTSTPR